MRILLVSHARKDPDGGASRVYHLLEDGLRERGHFVKTIHHNDFEIPRFAEKIVSRLFMAEAASRRAAKEPVEEYDVIMSSSGMLYPLFKKLKQKPMHPLLVNHLHGLSFFDHQATLEETMRGHMSISWIYRMRTGPLPLLYDEYGSRYADLTIVQNGRDLDYLQDKGFSPLVSIPLTVHPEILAAGISAPSPEERDPNALLWFGSWVERKGCHYLPRAFKKIVERHPEARLTIGGTAAGEEFLKSRFEPHLREKITVLPRVTREEQIDIYSRHAIFLFPSLSEGFGFALLEAMSMGLAAVTTDTGLGGDCLRDRENAMVVPASSALHLAQGVSTLMEHNKLRCKIARNGQALSRLFTFDRFIDAYEAAFTTYSKQ